MPPISVQTGGFSEKNKVIWTIQHYFIGTNSMRAMCDHPHGQKHVGGNAPQAFWAAYRGSPDPVAGFMEE